MKIFPKNLISPLFLFLCQLAVAAPPAGWVVGWGDDVSGKATGIPYFGHTNGVVTIDGQPITNAIAVTAGMNYSLAIRSDGTVVGWGLDSSGQATGSINPDWANGVVKIDGQVLSNVVTIATGVGSSLALKSDGTVAAWGTKFNGSKMQVAPGLSNVVSITAGLNLAVKNDGTVVDIFNNQTIEGLSNIVAIVAPQIGIVGGGGMGGMVVLKKDGTIASGRLHGVEPFRQIQGISNATAIAVGDQEGFALKSDGTIAAWYHPNEIPAGLSNVVAIAAGNYHCLALKNDGTVVAWGLNDRLALGVPAGLSNLVAIAAGNDFSLAITTNAAVAEKLRH